MTINKIHQIGLKSLNFEPGDFNTLNINIHFSEETKAEIDFSASLKVTSPLMFFEVPTINIKPFGNFESTQYVLTISRMRLLKRFLLTAFPYFFDTANARRIGISLSVLSK